MDVCFHVSSVNTYQWYGCIRVDEYLTFLEIAKLFFKVVLPFAFPPAVYMSYSSSMCLSALGTIAFKI